MAVLFIGSDLYHLGCCFAELKENVFRTWKSTQKPEELLQVCELGARGRISISIFHTSHCAIRSSDCCKLIMCIPKVGSSLAWRAQKWLAQSLLFFLHGFVQCREKNQTTGRPSVGLQILQVAQASRLTLWVHLSLFKLLRIFTL